MNQRRLVVTSNFVLAEFHALAVKRRGPRPALAALEGIRTGSMMIVQADETDEIRAMDVLRKYTDKGYSLVDAISFSIMARLAISKAFTFDRHFFSTDSRLSDYLNRQERKEPTVSFLFERVGSGH